MELNSGSSYVVFGSGSAFAATVNLSTLNGTNGFRLDGEAASDYSGISVSSAGDINGDGYDDLIIGAYAADPNGILAALVMLCLARVMALIRLLIFLPLTAPTASASTVRWLVIKVATQSPVRATLTVTAMMT